MANSINLFENGESDPYGELYDVSELDGELLSRYGNQLCALASTQSPAFETAGLPHRWGYLRDPVELGLELAGRAVEGKSSHFMVVQELACVGLVTLVPIERTRMVNSRYMDGTPIDEYAVFASQADAWLATGAYDLKGTVLGIIGRIMRQRSLRGRMLVENPAGLEFYATVSVSEIQGRTYRVLDVGRVGISELSVEGAPLPY